MPNTQLQLRRGTTAEHAVFTGAQGELTYNTTTKKIHLHDGGTVGGFAVPSASDLTNLVTKSTMNVVAKTEQQGVSYTLVLTDVYVRAYHTAAQTITIPTNANVPFPVGTQITIIQVGAGSTTIAAAPGATINFGDSLVCRKQWSAVTITKVAADVWDLVGDVRIS